MLHPIDKQTNKFKLAKQIKIYNAFHMSLLKEDTIKEERIDKMITKLELHAGNTQKYKVGAICNNTVSSKKVEDYLSGLYYFVM